MVLLKGGSAGQKRPGDCVKMLGLSLALAACDTDIQDAAPEDKDDVVSAEVCEPDPRDLHKIRRAGLLVPSA
jgi:hypothetical protein